MLPEYSLLTKDIHQHEKITAKVRNYYIKLYMQLDTNFDINLGIAYIHPYVYSYTHTKKKMSIKYIKMLTINKRKFYKKKRG